MEVEELRAYQEFAQKKPIAYARQVLGIDPWGKQRAVLRDFVDPGCKYLAVRSGNGVGKTFLSSVLIAQYLDTHAPGYAVVTGASWQSVMKTVWPNFRRIHRTAPVDLGGKVQMTEWKRGDQWAAFCVSPDEPENISGYRTKNGALVLVDEASALKWDVYEAIQGVCSAAGSKIVLLGNPLRPEGPFYEAFRSPLYRTHHISSWEAAETGIQGLATREWCQDRLEEWGEESPEYQARVQGEFPKGTEFTLIRVDWIEKRIFKNEMPKTRGELILGVDVARTGDDRTCLVLRDDRTVREIQKEQVRDLMQVAGMVVDVARKYELKPENIRIDDTGLGGGVTDRLHEVGLQVFPVNFGSRAQDRNRFANTRAEMYWELREAIRPGADDPLWIPAKYKGDAMELSWTEYFFRSGGQIAMESKDKIKKRRGQSPDVADALALTFAPQTSNFSFGTL